MTVLQTKNISKKYKRNYAVKGVNMHIEEGDIYGFVGENGAGKTTIIRLVSGLASASEGSYELYGIDSKDKNIYKVRSSMGGIVEAVSLNKSMTPLDNLKYQCMITGIKKTDNELIDLIKLVGLDYEQIKNKKVGNFSLGMRQRLGIAVIMASDSKFIVLDEPMNGLDPQGFIEVRETILRLHEHGVTFLISSHILSELEKICTKIGFISRGVLLEELSIDELHNKSRKRIVIEADGCEELLGRLTAQFGLSEAQMDSGKAVIFDKIDVNDVMKYLVDNGIRVGSINVLEDTVEDYYIKLMGRSVINE